MMSDVRNVSQEFWTVSVSLGKTLFVDFSAWQRLLCVKSGIVDLFGFSFVFFSCPVNKSSSSDATGTLRSSWTCCFET